MTRHGSIATNLSAMDNAKRLRGSPVHDDTWHSGMIRSFAGPDVRFHHSRRLRPLPSHTAAKFCYGCILLKTPACAVDDPLIHWRGIGSQADDG